MAGADDIEQLREQLARYRTLADAAFEGLAVHEGGLIIDGNEAFAAMFGYGLAEMRGMPLLDLAAPESREHVLLKIRAGAEQPYEALGRRKDGTRFAVQLRGRPVVLSGRALRATALRDIGDSRRASGALDRVTDAFTTYDPSFWLTFANQAALDLFKAPLQQLLGRVLFEAFPMLAGTEMEQRLREAMASQQPVELEVPAPLTRRIIALRAFPSPDGLTVYSRDVTEQRRAEQQLREAQKLEAIGRLAGGVAHDFNNMLTVILSQAALLRRAAPPAGPFAAGITELEQAATRAADITRQLLAFGRRQVLRAQVLDLNQLVRASEPVIRRLVREDIEVRIFPSPDLGAIEADETQVEQVLINLVANARDAMPSGGTLSVETANVELDAAYASTHQGVTPGSYVLLSVTDTGVGMDRETAERVFEPFFTTKKLGQGTGLGLATVFGVVTQSRGHIWVYSEPGRGSTFKVYLPRVPARAAQVSEAATPLQATTGTEKILVVEDEGAVRRVLVQVLRGAGYAVVDAASPREALAAWQAAGGAELLLTDVVMPGMNARELANTLARESPGLRVIYMSGYTENVIVHGVLDEGVAFMQKPVTADALLRMVRAVLDAPVPPSR